MIRSQSIVLLQQVNPEQFLCNCVKKRYSVLCFVDAKKHHNLTKIKITVLYKNRNTTNNICDEVLRL